MHARASSLAVVGLLLFPALACARPRPAVPAPGAGRDSLGVADLPLIEVPAARPGGRTLALWLTGDGGWRGLDRGAAGELSARGVAVVGFNSRVFLERRRTPEETADAVARVLRHYEAAWGRDRLVLVGYSRGADVLPFVLNRLPSDVRSRVELAAMLGLSDAVSFQFHLTDLFRDVHRPTDVPIRPELERVHGVRLLCVYGTEEKDSLCRAEDPSLLTRVALPGHHHFDGDYRGLGDLIAARLTP